MAQHEDGPLPAVEPIDRRGEPGAPLARQQPRLGIGGGVPLNAGRASSTPVASSAGANQRSRRAARLAAIEAAVDENAREPDLERPGLAVRADVAEDLDERVLHRFVGFGGVAEILIGDAQRAALMDGDQLGEPLARLVGLAALARSSRISTASRVSSLTLRLGCAADAEHGRASRRRG